MNNEQLQRLLEAVKRVEDLTEHLRELEDFTKFGIIRNHLLLPGQDGIPTFFSLAEAPVIRHAVHELKARCADDLRNAKVELAEMLQLISVPINFGLPF